MKTNKRYAVAHAYMTEKPTSSLMFQDNLIDVISDAFEFHDIESSIQIVGEKIRIYVFDDKYKMEDIANNQYEVEKYINDIGVKQASFDSYTILEIE